MSAKKFGPKDGGSYLQRARERWPRMPEWVEMLARAADEANSHAALAKKVGIAPATISALIGQSYRGRLDIAEAKVRGALMNATVHCPVEGVIGRDRCVANQKLPFSACHPARAQLFFACKRCPNAIVGVKP